jgi:uncharacterized protein with gpF-like domain
MSYELIDESEYLLFAVVIEELKRQKGLIFDDPALIFTDAFWAAEFAMMADALRPLINEVVAEAIEFGVADLASVVDVDPVIENASIFAEQQTGQLITKINDTTRNEVQDILARSVEENWDLARLTEELTPLFGEQRAKLIAITETTNAYQGGADFAAAELQGQGYNAVLVWSTVRDSRVCQICEPRDGKVQGDGWQDTGAAHPGCRCDVIVEIKDD